MREQSVVKSFFSLNQGIACVVAQQPFDNVKMLMQVEPKRCPTILKSISYLMKNDGPYGFYKGIIPPLLGVGFVTALSFGVYDNTNKYLLKNTKMDYVTSSFTSGAIVGLLCTFITSPSELVKTKIQMQEPNDKLYSGNVDCLRKIFKNEGMKGLFKGFGITSYRETIGYGVYFASYEWMKKMWGDSSFALINAGGIAGSLSWYVVYPVDTIKSRMQSLPILPREGHDKYKNWWDCTKQTYKAEGLKSFFRGAFVTSLTAYPVNAVTFLVYERVLKYLREKHHK